MGVNASRRPAFRHRKMECVTQEDATYRCKCRANRFYCSITRSIVAFQRLSKIKDK